MFLIVSIIASLFAVSAVSTSAATLSKPTGIRVTNNAYGVTLSWTPVKGATGYQVYCKCVGERNWRTPLRTFKSSIFITDNYSTGKEPRLMSGWQYYFQVRAINGSFSNVISHFYLAKPIIYSRVTRINTRTNQKSVTLSFYRGGGNIYGIAKFVNGKFIRYYYVHDNDGKHAYFIDNVSLNSNSKTTYQVRDYCSINNKSISTSVWSAPHTV